MFHFLSWFPLNFVIVKCSSKRFEETTGDLHRRAGCNVQERCVKRGGERKSVSCRIKSQSINHSQSLAGSKLTLKELQANTKKTGFCLREAPINIAGGVGQDSAPRETPCQSREHKHCYMVLQQSGNKVKRRKVKWRKVTPQDKHENKRH